MNLLFIHLSGAATHGRITGMPLALLSDQSAHTVALLVYLSVSIHIQKEQGLARPALLLFSRAAPALHPAVPASAGGGVGRYAAVDLLYTLLYHIFCVSALHFSKRHSSPARVGARRVCTLSCIAYTADGAFGRLGNNLYSCRAQARAVRRSRCTTSGRRAFRRCGRRRIAAHAFRSPV